jgi:PIN domain nuclease of toxin-antitoxin system
VLEAPALLAMVFDEPAAEAAAEFVADGAAGSTVTLAAVATALTRTRRAAAERVRAALPLGVIVRLVRGGEASDQPGEVE